MAPSWTGLARGVNRSRYVLFACASTQNPKWIHSEAIEHFELTLGGAVQEVGDRFHTCAYTFKRYIKLHDGDDG
jgi:hypothetical protein